MRNWIIENIKTRVRFNKLFYLLGLQKIIDEEPQKLKKDKIIKFNEGFVMMLKAKSIQEYSYYNEWKTQGGHVALAMTNFMKKNLRKGQVFVDCGANSGYFTLLASKLVGGGRVYSFEPAKEAFKRLSTNIRINKMQNIVTYNIGLANKAREAYFYTQTGDGGNSLLKLLDSKGRPKYKVKLRKLDEIVKGKIDLIKIDVEGYEKETILGAQDLIRQHKPKIMFEFNYTILFQKNKQYNEVFDVLKEYGYKEFIELQNERYVTNYKDLSGKLVDICALK